LSKADGTSSLGEESDRGSRAPLWVLALPGSTQSKLIVAAEAEVGAAVVSGAEGAVVSGGDEVELGVDTELVSGAVTASSSLSPQKVKKLAKVSTATTFMTANLNFMRTILSSGSWSGSWWDQSG